MKNVDQSPRWRPKTKVIQFPVTEEESNQNQSFDFSLWH